MSEVQAGKYKMQRGEHLLSAYRDAEGREYIITRDIHHYLGITYYIASHMIPRWENEEKLHRISVVGSKARYVNVKELDLLRKEIHQPIPEPSKRED